MTTKVIKSCSKCNKKLPCTLKYFHKHSTGKYGFNPVCKDCRGGKTTAHSNNDLVLWDKIWEKANSIKRCSRCKKEFPSNKDYFSKRNNVKSGLNSICKVCDKTESLRYYKDNKKQVKNNSKLWQENNKDYVRKKAKIYRDKNKKALRLTHIKWYKNNKEHLKDYQKKRKDVTKDYQKKYQKNNRTILNEKRNNKLKTILLYAVQHRVRGVVSGAFKRMGYKKTTQTAKMIGCDWPTLKKHIENKFTKGMSWDVFDKIHIDHIIPLSTAKTEEEIIKLNHYRNLQPLWAEDNFKKAAKTPVNHQTSLPL